MWGKIEEMAVSISWPAKNEPGTSKRKKAG